MKRICFLIPFLCAALHAQKICSYVGTTPCANTPLTYKNAAGAQVPVSLLYSGVGAPSLAGASYVTYMQGAAPITTTVYTTTFSGSIASIQIMADDSATMALNGVSVPVPKVAYNTWQTVQIPQSALSAGTNTLVLSVTNTYGPTGIGFFANMTAPAPVVVPPVTTAGNYTFGPCAATVTVTPTGYAVSIANTCPLTKVGP